MDPAPTIQLDAAFGAGGRRTSRRIRQLREASAANEGTTRMVYGRAFRRVSGVYTDPRYRAGGAELRLRPRGEAYFALLRSRPALRHAFSLGDEVVVTIDGGKSVIVSANAPAGVSASDVARFLE